MMKQLATLVILSLFSVCRLQATGITPEKVLYAGPYQVTLPYQVDSLNVKGEKFVEKDLLKMPVSFDKVRNAGRLLTHTNQVILPGVSTPYAIGLVCFYITSDRYTEGSLSVKGEGKYEVYVNDALQKPDDGKIKLALEPRRYEVIVKCLQNEKSNTVLRVAYEPKGEAVITVGTSPERAYSLSDVTDGLRIRSAAISPDGKYILVNYQKTHPGGRQQSYSEVLDRAKNSVVLTSMQGNMHWMPKSNLLYAVEDGMEGRELITLDPLTKAKKTLAAGLPEGTFRFAPTEDYLLYTIREKGPEKDKDMQEIIEPDDRQPGWRDRSFLHKYDLQSGVMQRLTFGHSSTAVNDISQDGRYLLFSSRERILTEQPFSRTTLYKMDLHTLNVEILLKDAKYINRAVFSPDMKQLLVAASPAAFDGIGLNVASGQIANLGDTQLFLLDTASKKAVPLTKDFNPSVDDFTWNPFDKQIYVLAKNRDCVHLYTIDPVKKGIRHMPVKEDVLSDMSIASQAPEMVYVGMSGSNAQRLYSLEMRKGKSGLLLDLSKEQLKDVRLGELRDWNFVSQAGDTIFGRYYLPPNFDPNERYPLIVNYYGGTTPTARVLESRYPSHVYAGLGYVVYIVQPSGATGFGQEFSARHVNTWGKQTAEDIIEGTKKFCEAHPFINKEKIGCIGASYGGFMTMYLHTRTGLFATGISHAGISDITSYWGEGYWGYSYSGQASTDSYPWNARDLYVNQSPLFSADKINKPILFLHGSADTNVPVGESIQMFTALKLLGKETALIQVEGEDHRILHYGKRIKWNNTIYAWFAKWLKGQPEWWEALYPEKHL